MSHRAPKSHHAAANNVVGHFPNSPRRTRVKARPVVEALEGRTLLASSVIGNVTMPYNGTLSAAVYDSQGHLVKSLLQGATETMGEKVGLTWDGTDQFGNPVPNNLQYQWRAAFSQAGGANTDDIGNSGSPSFGLTKANGGIDGVATDPSGDVYSVSWWEEMHNELRKYAPDGSTLWEIPSVGAYGGVAADSSSVYVAISASQNGNQDRIYRYSSAAGDPVNFTSTGANYITVNTGQTGTGTEFDQEPLHGMAVDSTDLFVSDYLNNRVDVYDKNSGTLLAQFPVSQPLGIAVQSEPNGSAPGELWVANGGNAVTQYAFTIQNGAYTFTATGKQVGNLSNPYGVAIGGPSGHLYVTESGTTINDVREYDVSGTTPVPAGLKVFGHLAAPGPVTDTGFRGLGAIAVDATGRLTVSDTGDRRLMTYNPDGTTLRSVFGEFQPDPIESPGTVPGTYELTSGPWEYEVESDGVAQPGWMGDGTWRLADNWEPADGQFAAPIAHKLTFTVDGVSRDYIYYLGGNYGGAAIYQISADGTSMVRSSIVGTNWIGTTGTATPDGGRYVWTDSDGTGQVEASEVNWNVAAGLGSGVVSRDSNLWVDSSGAIWFGNLSGQTVKLPLLGFDANGNPEYDWSKVQTVVTTAGLAGLSPEQTRVAANGDIYEAGNPVYFVTGGREINRYDSNGNLLTQLVLPGNEETAGLAISPDSDYFFAGENSSGFGYAGGRTAVANNWIDMYTADGLRVATIQTDPNSDGIVGWFDDGMALASYSANGQLYVAGENVLYGDSTTYQVTGLSTIERLSGSFTWPQNPTVVTIAATTPTTSVGGSQPGTFTVTRSNTTGPLTVYYAASGTATQADYAENLITQPTYSENFDEMTQGPVNNQNGWVGTSTDVIQNSVAESGNALKVTGEAYTFNPFPANAAPIETLNFDFQLSSDINDYSGTPNVALQDTVMDIRGPNNLNNNTDFQLLYGASTDAGGNIVLDQLQLRGANTVYAVNSPDALNSIGKDVWYHVSMAINLASGTATATVQSAGAAPWTSGVVSGYANTSYPNLLLTSASNSPLYLDNIQVVPGQSPAGEGSVTIPDGQSTATINVTPINDPSNEGDKTLRLMLQPDNAYVVGASDEDAISILGGAPAPAAGPVVTVSASTAGGSTGGTFTFSRTGPATSPLSVRYTVRGTADPRGYAPALTGTVTIPAGQSSQVVTIATSVGATAAESGNVIVALSPDPSGIYTVGGQSSANVAVVLTAATPPAISVSASSPTVSKQGGQSDTFVVSRSGSTAGALSVQYTIGGTAPMSAYLVNGVQGPGVGGLGLVTIPTGQASATITVAPIDDGLVSGDRSVQIVLDTNASYVVGTQSNDAIVIQDNLLPTVSISATSPDAVSSTSTPGVFVVSRNSTAGNLTVDYDVSGTATANDYLEPLGDITKQNFDGLKIGSFNGQGGWSANSWDDVVENKVAVTGNALMVTDQVYRPDDFLPTAQSPTQLVSFDFLLPDVISDHVGTPNYAIQNTVMEVDGPDASAGNDFALVYGAGTSGNGTVILDQLQLRGANTIYAVNSPDALNDIQANVWYHVSMAVNFEAKTATATVQASGGPSWTSGTVTGNNSGNANLIVAHGYSPFYLDNIQVDQGSSPSGEGFVTIPDGQTSATITVTPINNGTVTNGQTVQLTLAGGPGYTLGSRTQGLVTIATAPAPTALLASTVSAVSSASGSSAFGQLVTFTATVASTSSSGTAPTGTVALLDGGNVIATSTLNASGVATFSVGSLQIGSHMLTVAYQGDSGNLAGTSAAFAQQVYKDLTSLTLAASSGTTTFGQPLTFTATVASVPPASGLPTGSVTFMDGASTLSVVTLVNGAATLTESVLPPGGHAITAVYSGDGDDLGSTSPALIQSIYPAATSTSVTSSSPATGVGQPVTLTATVTAAGPVWGSVTFMDGSTPLGTSPISGGRASLTTSAMSGGVRTITAVYSGDSGNLPSTSPVLTQTVKPLATAVNVAVSNAAPAFGQTVTYTATVATSAVGLGTPTGTVTFAEGPLTLGTATLSGGVATLVSSAAPTGEGVVTATYSGDTNDPAGVSASVGLNVSRAATTVTLTSFSGVSLNPGLAAYDQPLTFTATVAAASPAGTTPTGTASLLDGGNVIATSTLNASGVATFTVGSLTVGGHSLTVAYQGDGCFLASTSAPLSQQVNQDATSATLAATSGTTSYGQSLTFTATVAAASPGSGLPTGSVTFMDGTSALGVVPLVNGAAALTESNLSTGGHAITAVYAGDTNDLASTSTALIQSVFPDATSTSVTSSSPTSAVGQPVTLTATVTTVGPVWGSVTFMDGSTPLGTSPISGGRAALTTSAISGGIRTITAVFSGDGVNLPSTSPEITQTVRSPATTVNVTVSNAAPAFGQTVTYTATVATSAVGLGTPTGTVAFTDGPLTLGTATLTGGVATLTSTAAPTGVGVITATYSGDANNQSGVSPSVGLNVSRAATSVALTSSAATASFGQSVQFAATVIPVSPGAGTPTGVVTFIDGTTTIGTAPLVNGVATFATTSLGLGSHSISAFYGGDANDLGTAAPAFSQSVQKAATSTVLRSTGSSVAGQAVTFNATVRLGQSGMVSPSGSVTFLDGTAVLGTVPTSGGTATLTTRALSVGKHAVSAVYNGDATTAPSAPASLSLLVAQSRTVTTLAASSPTPAPGQKVVLSATVASVAPGSGTPTGVVVFIDGKATLGTAPVVGGKASLTVTFSGNSTPHVISAAYSGDTNFLGGKALSLTEIVTQPVAVKPGVTAAPIGRAASAVITLSSTSLGGPIVRKTATVAKANAISSRPSAVAAQTARVPAPLSGFKTYNVVYS